MRTVTLSWRAPTTYESGEKITQPLTYDVFQIGRGPASIATGVKGTTYKLELPNLGEHCFYVRAVAAGIVGPGSDIACVP